MSKRHGDGFFLPSLFDFLEIETEEKKRTLSHIRNCGMCKYNPNALIWILFDADSTAYGIDREALRVACEANVLKYVLVDTDTGETFLDDAVLAKARELFQRKQYGSKILQELMAKICLVFERSQQAQILGRSFSLLLQRGIWEDYRRICDEKLEKELGPLKKAVDKIASGVRHACYKGAETVYPSFFPTLSAPLQEYARQNGCHFDWSPNCDGRYSLAIGYDEGFHLTNAILQYALLEDAAFWDEHSSFNIVLFLNAVEQYNDLRHAQKLLLSILNALKKDDFSEKVMAKGLPLYMCRTDGMKQALEARTFEVAFIRLSHCCDLSYLPKERLLYPMNVGEDSEKKRSVGKAIWEKFLLKYTYPHCADSVARFLESEMELFARQEEVQGSAAIVLDKAPFGYFDRKELLDAQFCELLCPDFFSTKNIWERHYLKIYCISCLDSREEVVFSYIHRAMLDLFSFVEQKTGMQTVHQIDQSERDAHFKALQNKMASYGIVISEEKRFDYTTALLDLDMATPEECMRFPTLEQLGDTIYGFALGEMLFYRPDCENMGARYNDFVSAARQVEIAKQNGFEKLYLAAGVAESAYLYEIENGHHIPVARYLKTSEKDKHLADSFEMIVGALCLDKGIETAVDFVKMLLRATFPNEFLEEVRPTEENRRNDDIEWDYWQRILPAPSYFLSGDTRTFFDAFGKMFLAVCIGTETKEKRGFLTHGVYYSTEKMKFSDISWCFYEYLHFGVAFVLKKYRESLLMAYSASVK